MRRWSGIAAFRSMACAGGSNRFRADTLWNSEDKVKTSAYTLFGFRAGYEYKPWNIELLFEARNLADENYVSAVVVDTADDRFFQPGEGRSFYGGLRWKW